MQVIGSLSRIGLSVMTSAPPNRTGRFSDSQALTRAVQRPAHAFEAFGRCWEELFNAFMNALLGIPLDPTKVGPSDEKHTHLRAEEQRALCINAFATQHSTPK